MHLFSCVTTHATYLPLLKFSTGSRCRDFRRHWKKALQEADISNLRFHDLRHTVATRLVKQGVPLPVVKEVLDHSDIKTTMRYNHIGNKQVVEAMELLGSHE